MTSWKTIERLIDFWYWLRFWLWYPFNSRVRRVGNVPWLLFGLAFFWSRGIHLDLATGLVATGLILAFYIASMVLPVLAFGPFEDERRGEFLCAGASLAWLVLGVRLYWAHNTYRDVGIALVAMATITVIIVGKVYFRNSIKLVKEERDSWNDMSDMFGMGDDEPEKDEGPISVGDRLGVSVQASAIMLFVAIPMMAALTCTFVPTYLEREPLPRTLQTQTQVVGPIPGPHTALALSGGGYRAAAVHAGVLDALSALHVKVTHMSSVSGGSIIGAYYALGGSPQDFIDAVVRGRFNLRAELIDIQNVFRLALPWFSRANVQANLLDRILFRAATSGDLDPSAPLYMICATDLMAGQGVGFSADGMLFVPVATLTGRSGSSKVSTRASRFVHATGKGFPVTERLASLVTASGAFPGAVSPLTIEYEGERFRLADGGLFDNSGVRLILERNRLAAAKNDLTWKLDLVIASDAGALLTDDSSIGFIDDLSRAADIVYANSTVMNATVSSPTLPILRLSPPELARRLQADPGLVTRLSQYAGMSAQEVQADLAADLVAFAEATTLEDRLGAKAKALYQLGRYLVWAWADDIQQAIKSKSLPLAG